MRAAYLLLTAVVAVPLVTRPVLAQTSHAKPLTVDAIYAHGSLIGEVPDQLTWSPDGKHLTYLDNGALLDLDLATGKGRTLVGRDKLAALDEAAATETDRDHRSRYKMASYFWSPDSTHLLFDSNGRLWLYDLHAGVGVDLGSSGEGSGDDPKFSPDGTTISFIHDHGLAVIHLQEAGTPIHAVAPAPNPDSLNGQVDWVYEEELDVRSNYFWSPDSTHLAYLQMNEANVPQYPITDWIPTHARVDLQRYPQPGDPNPDVRVGVVSPNDAKTVWINLPTTAGQDYIPRFGWVDAKTVWVETLTRSHKHRSIYFAEAATGQAHQVLEISDDKFLDENYDLSVEHGTIVLTNWSDGHNHIYLYRYDTGHPETAIANLDRQLTHGDFEVGEVLSVDTVRGIVDYASNEGNPLEQQFWEVNFSGKRTQLTHGEGYHTGSVAPSGTAFVDRLSTRMDPPTVRLCTRPDACTVFWQTRALEPYRLSAPQQLQVMAHDGSTLYATLLLPEGANAAASVPLIVNPYGGPGPQTVANRWSDSLLFDELLAEHGFAVLHADNRGTGGRGRAFAQAAYHDFGPMQLEDQITVVDSVLARYPQLDPKRLGWWGWSWGGTFTLYSLTHSDRFRAGVAVAPVTDWRNYDSIYTERYMSTPAEFPSGYHDFSVVNSAAQLHGHLLLVHGTGDDNVHIENSVQFIQQLIEAGIPYDFQIYPRKTHSIAGPDVRTHLFNRILAQFEQYLKPPAQ